ncbi:MAG: hypothetical protein GY913_04885 [Proteobacteria bacterium]|nr:hypothetical protein [Pseudomonadota bacterium]MCP4916237.1 hypothetical protein [Pseudomonadota bacterium]
MSIPRPADADIDTIEKALDAASTPERVAWMRSLKKADMVALYTKAEGRDVGPDFFVGPDGAAQTWTGRNSLPAFNDFAKAFANHSDRIQGYNVNTGVAAWFGGPGHFLVRLDNAEHGAQLIFDYIWEVDTVPAGFPAVASNTSGTHSLVYGNMKDVVRRVSNDLIISEAWRKGKKEGAYFSLTRPA